MNIVVGILIIVFSIELHNLQVLSNEASILVSFLGLVVAMYPQILKENNNNNNERKKND
ncbi:MAG: hypothetical protein O3A39_06760 [Proteobacteria bacterium]|nr:hypothetical protein [Pseudomonadota bacterium]